MTGRFTGRVAIVTGAASGIGTGDYLIQGAQGSITAAFPRSLPVILDIIHDLSRGLFGTRRWV